MTLEVTSNLANSLAYQRKFDDAVGIHRRVLSVHRRTHGFEHEITLMSTTNLGMVLCNMGKYTEAETMLREVLTAARRTLGSEHSSTLNIAALATVLNTQGKAAESEKLYEEVLAMRRRVLGPDHTDTLTTVSNLANARVHAGQARRSRSDAVRGGQSAGTRAWTGAPRLCVGARQSCDILEAD